MPMKRIAALTTCLLLPLTASAAKAAGQQVRYQGACGAHPDCFEANDVAAQ